MQTADISENINSMIDNLNKKEYSSATNKIPICISKNQQLTVWIDPEITTLKLEIKNLEHQLNILVNEKAELEKLLSEFQHRYTIELGDIILEILKLRKMKFKQDKTKYAEAEQDEKQYQEQVSNEREKNFFELTDEQKKELKKKYRKGAVLCHTNGVCHAPQIFIKLTQAYHRNDLKLVTEILDALEKNPFKPETVFEKDLLKAEIDRLHRQIEILEREIIDIKESDAFKTIADIQNWNEYFKDVKNKLQKELEELQIEINE